jgi:hypothetical protein
MSSYVGSLEDRVEELEEKLETVEAERDRLATALVQKRYDFRNLEKVARFGLEHYATENCEPDDGMIADIQLKKIEALCADESSDSDELMKEM